VLMWRAAGFVADEITLGLHPALCPPARIAQATGAWPLTSPCLRSLTLVRPLALWSRLTGPRLGLLRPLLTSRSGVGRRASTHLARYPRVRTHSFAAQPPDLRRLALITKVLRFHARSPCLATPSMPVLVHWLAALLHAYSPHSVTLMQLRFAVINLRRDLHPQECARAGRT
jgi:hypothetical protein